MTDEPNAIARILANAGTTNGLPVASGESALLRDVREAVRADAREQLRLLAEGQGPPTMLARVNRAQLVHFAGEAAAVYLIDKCNEAFWVKHTPESQWVLSAGARGLSLEPCGPGELVGPTDPPMLIIDERAD